MIKKIVININYYRKLIIGKYRYFLGACPFCNSDAPELYNCPCCEFYTGTFPPTKTVKDYWFNLYKDAITCQKKARLLIIKYRR